MSYHADGHVFTGDALLVRSCGRTDFQNGDAGALYDSITKVLFALPDETIVWPGHDYRGMTQTTIGEEKRFNPRVANHTREEFIGIMRELNLPPPARIAEAVPANRACGNPEET
jgi:glyoxylase-like metal-dependent hydrolase (beta-lactamase superfamily II)